MMIIAANGRAPTRPMATNDPELKSAPNPLKLTKKISTQIQPKYASGVYQISRLF